MEGKFYYAIWSISKGVNVLYLQGNEDIRGEANDFELAKELLYQSILEWNGDGEPQIEILNYSSDEWYLCNPIGYSEVDDVESYFIDGVCESCSYPRGQRSKKPFDLRLKPSAGITSIQTPVERIYLFRGSLVRKLQMYSNNSLTFREVFFKGLSTDYFELLNEPRINYVLENSISLNEKYRTTFICKSCQRVSYTGKQNLDDYFFPKHEFNSVIEVIRPDALTKASIAINGTLLKDGIKRNKAEKFLTTKIKLLDEGEFYIPEVTKEVDFIDWG
ncbi:hypothetical protein [Pleionea litopenaei]|uniref:Uncharacterized protein n=1 Tax=Pleionea litopenaei TaxID=3070815 RepID=A0AA51X8A6_9GAMM|nr:hypothetical protein [Pleionea sp. HL-JVS1]WMS87910.1 hypothetical protein Q9312_03075 [Pleionea sp. HL-JVS1]